MLSPDKIPTHANVSHEQFASADVINLDQVIAMARRQWRLVAACSGIFFVLGIVYALTAVPVYTASTTVLIDRSNIDIVNQMSNTGPVIDDEASVLSQVELLKSDTIALDVVDKLNLINNPQFTKPQQSVLSLGTLRGMLDFRAWFGTVDKDDVDDAEAKKRAAAASITKAMGVTRVGKSYVLAVSYTSQSPDLAMEIAGGIADAYLLDKLNSKYDATRRASVWLQERIDELRQNVLQSDLAVQKFRTEHGLVSVSESGQLLTDQQLSELNSALIVAQADTAKAQARYDRIKAIIDAKQTDAIVTDVLGSSISNDLRKKYLEASKLEAEISARLGPDHVQAVRLRAEMQEYERLMFEELNRIAESYQSDVQVAKSREDSLKKSVADATGVAASAGETQVQLRELERTSDSYKNLYQTFLTRYQEATQQQSFPITDARIITRSVKPSAPSAPKKPIVLAIAVILGAMVGGGIGAFREFRDRFFRTGEDVRSVLGLEFLGMAPLIKAVAADSSSAGEFQGKRSTNPGTNVTDYVVDHPVSMFAETLRSTKIAVDLETKDIRQGKVVGVVSSLPSEGKSTTAINFAKLLAMQGNRTLLIDGDLRNPGATRLLGRHSEEGILEVLLGGRPLRETMLLDPKTRLGFLPAVLKQRVPHSSELVASNNMIALLNEAKDSFDYIIVDLPPLGPVVDARAMLPQLDTLVFVIEWGKTSHKVVHGSLLLDPEMISKCAGVILTKVDSEKMKLYRTFGSNEYYYDRYSAYYNEG